MTFSEAKQALARKLNIDYTDIANNDLFSDTDLGDWINFGLLRAWDYKRWNFTEGAKTKILSAGEITNGYIDSPTDFMLGSIYLARINGKEWGKKDYSDYLKWFEDNPGDTSKFWSQLRTFIFFNNLAAAAGQTLDLYGKSKATQMVNTTDLLPFSQDTDNEEYSGNNAIVLLAYAEALSSEKKNNPNQGMIEEKRAFFILDLLWKPFEENKSIAQSVNRPFLDVPDFFGKGGQNTGKFSS